MESPGQFMHIVNAFRRGLSGAGYVCPSIEPNQPGMQIMGTAPCVLVTGAGMTGGEVLRQLVASNVVVRALVRDPQRAEPYNKIGVELVKGDFAEPNGLFVPDVP
jgi:NAD(P)H-binding